MFLGAKSKVYVLDKTENNPVNITNQWGTHPAWSVEYDIDSNDCKQRAGQLPGEADIRARPYSGRVVEHILRRRGSAWQWVMGRFRRESAYALLGNMIPADFHSHHNGRRGIQ